jgi:hypothetical protein
MIGWFMKQHIHSTDLSNSKLMGYLKVWTCQNWDIAFLICPSIQCRGLNHIQTKHSCCYWQSDNSQCRPYAGSFNREMKVDRSRKWYPLSSLFQQNKRSEDSTKKYGKPRKKGDRHWMSLPRQETVTGLKWEVIILPNTMSLALFCKMTLGPKQ